MGVILPLLLEFSLLEAYTSSTQRDAERKCRARLQVRIHMRHTPKGTKECHQGNSPLILRQPLQALRTVLATVTGCHKLTVFTSLDSDEPFQNHKRISALDQVSTGPAELDAVDRTH